MKVEVEVSEKRKKPSRRVSFSEIDTYRQCRLKWQLSYIEHWRHDDDAPGVFKSPALERGTLFHSVMENHYLAVKAFQDGDEVKKEQHKREVKRLLQPEYGDPTEMQDIVQWMYEGYLENYGVDPDWTIVAVEQPFEFWLPSETGHRSSIKLKGTIDLLVKVKSMGNSLWLIDHKTCRNLPKDIEVDLDDQAAIYTYLLRRHGLDVRGHIRNAVRTERLKTREMVPQERFLRRLTSREDKELETMALEAMRIMREAYGSLKRENGKFEDLPRSPNVDTCRWKCPYTEPCLAGRQLGSKRMRGFLEDIGMSQQETKPGPTFNKNNS